jgi:hypothetical protein
MVLYVNMDMREFLETYFHTPGVQEQLNRMETPPMPSVQTPRMLRATWTRELEEDLLHVHGIKPPPIDHFKDSEDLFKI